MLSYVGLTQTVNSSSLMTHPKYKLTVKSIQISLFILCNLSFTTTPAQLLLPGQLPLVAPFSSLCNTSLAYHTPSRECHVVKCNCQDVRTSHLRRVKRKRRATPTTITIM